jgi:hypothetical protein
VRWVTALNSSIAVLANDRDIQFLHTLAIRSEPRLRATNARTSIAWLS